MKSDISDRRPVKLAMESEEDETKIISSFAVKWVVNFWGLFVTEDYTQN